MSTITPFEKLFSDFNRIHKINERLPTFMEISRYPHFENVCSNILSFYFDTTQSHKLSDLVLKSLLECTSFQFENYPPIVTKICHREYSTPDNKRIDLVIEGEDLVVAIENKIFHWLNNDLGIYEQTIINNFSKCNNKIFIVLSIKKEITTGSFVSITYEAFFKRLKQNLGDYAVNANNQYVTYLLDFIKTIENHYKMEDINKEMFDFIISNKDTINDINQQKNILQNKLNNLVWQISENISLETANVKKWIWEKKTIVFDFSFDDITISVDATVQYQSVNLDLFVRKNIDTYSNLAQLDLIKNNIFTKSVRGYELLHRNINFYEINQEELSKEIYNLLIQIKK
jgi:hypothetical protein